MDSHTRFRQLIAALPLELKLGIIYYAVQVDEAIESTPDSAGDEYMARFYQNSSKLSTAWPKRELIANLVSMFTADPQLHALALREFYRANVFQVWSEEDYEPETPLMPFVISECRLEHDQSRRPHARHIELFLARQNVLEDIDQRYEAAFGKQDIEILQRIPALYPKLQSLSVRIWYLINVEPMCEAALYHEPLRVIAWERQNWLKNILRAVRELRGVKHKAVQMDQASRVVKYVGDPVEIDGRGKDLNELVWEMMDMTAVVVRFS